MEEALLEEQDIDPEIKDNWAEVNDVVKYGVLVELIGKQLNRLYLFHEYLTIFKK